jgi:hypothetical protein
MLRNLKGKAIFRPHKKLPKEMIEKKISYWTAEFTPLWLVTGQTLREPVLWFIFNDDMSSFLLGLPSLAVTIYQ